MQFELDFEPDKIKEVRKILGLFKQVNKEYINPSFKSYYTEIWAYKDIRIINNQKTWGSTKEIWKGGKLIHSIEKPLETSNTELAEMLKPLLVDLSTIQCI